MGVHHDEGVAIHVGPEPCVGIREGVGEASAGECIGQPLSRERMFSREPTLSTGGRRHEGRDIASAQSFRRGRRPWHVQKLLVWEPGALSVGQMLTEQPGPRREGEEP